MGVKFRAAIEFTSLSNVLWFLECPLHSCLCAALVSFGTFTSEQKSQAEESGVAIYSWQEFLDLVSTSHLKMSKFQIEFPFNLKLILTLLGFFVQGAKNPVDLGPPTKNDLSTIMYTSGTTGEPKGVMLSHENVLTTIAGLDHFLKALDEEVRPDYCRMLFH